MTGKAQEAGTGETDRFAVFEGDVIGFDPFGGDFGDQGDRTFTDKMVRAARRHDDCHNCAEPILAGERHRYRVDRTDGDLDTFRWCWACCTAMARIWCEGGAADDEYDARSKLRWEKEAA